MHSGFSDAYGANREEFPVMQDQALGPSGDFGNKTCHACDYASDGYPEPDHKTVCDGVCRRTVCKYHNKGPGTSPEKKLKAAFRAAIRAGLTKEQIAAHLEAL